MIRRNITITEEQDQWLKQKKRFNLSGFIQEKLDEEKRNTKK